MRIIRLAHGLDTSHSVHKAMLKADTILNILSEGKMKIKIYLTNNLEVKEIFRITSNWKFGYDEISGAVLENLL